MASIDKYINQMLAEMEAPGPVQSVVHTILDEAIPDAVKKRLLKPIRLAATSNHRPSLPPHKARARQERP